ncbi:MAG TPA: cyclase family protein [Anaerovoracaceae bacterium]|nr:cyclase family protein [Anaerovoracaceae bacterium]
MKVVDLSHKFSVEDMVFPGTMGMSFERTHTTAEDHYNLSIARINSHSGTHTDAPLHFIAGGDSLGEVPIDRYVGSCVVADCRDKGAFGTIGIDDIKPYEDAVRKAGRVLICTGWSKHFNEECFFTDYPIISEELADYLVSLGIVLVGVEPPSLNPPKYIEVHQAFLKNNVAIVEGLTNLEALIGKEFIFCGAPLAFEDMDGFPVRAYAIEF